MFTVRCPVCRNKNCRKSKRSFVRAVAGLTTFRRYTCNRCYCRFWRPWPWRVVIRTD